jgi:hypothetical protein
MGDIPTVSTGRDISGFVRSLLWYIEGTHSQAVRTMRLRRTRFWGMKKTALQPVLTTTALNLIRLDAHLAGKKDGKAR